jgi:hypothetical protein
MTTMTLKELKQYSDVGRHEEGLRDLQARLREVKFRAELEGQDDAAKLAGEIIEEIHAICQKENEELDRLEAEVLEGETCRDEIEEAIADKFSWTIAHNIMEEARKKGRERREKAQQ